MSTGAAELLQDTGGTITDEAATATGEIAARSPLALFWRRLRQDKVALVALGFIVLLIFVAIFAGLIVKLFGAHPPNEQNPTRSTSSARPRAPGNGYIMGTDDLGRDVFSRTLYGARISLEVAFIATGLIVAHRRDAGHDRRLLPRLGRHRPVALDGRHARVPGAAAGARPRRRLLAARAACPPTRSGRDLFIAGVRDPAHTGLLGGHTQARGRAGFSAITGSRLGRCACAPGRGRDRLRGLVFALVVPSKATLIQPGLPVVIFVITLAGWPYMARIIRGQVLSLREKEFVEAARSLGASDARIIFRHILPNLVAPIIVYTTLLIPTNILFEAALSFLGVGVQPPTASWGAMIADAIGIFDTAWWYMTFPGVALLLTVLAFNLDRRRTAGRAQPEDGALRGARRERAVHTFRNKEEHV